MTPDPADKMPLNEDMSALRWAREFIDLWSGLLVGNSAIDENLMTSWFANAIMCGYDHGMRETQRRLEKEIERIAENHYWDSLEKDKPLILAHIHFIVACFHKGQKHANS